ncbi:MAG TPA: acyl-CoA desaturase [Candidatus Acidoferrales bacterium]|nr:acyl-CoA desaturase [Candidatus Acidoferrales bacterium]
MTSGKFGRVLIAVARWFDTSAGGTPPADGPQETDWLRCIPFAAVHLMCFGVIWVGWSPVAVAVAAALYFIRMFSITGFYHRYFSHRSFKTSRAAQLIFAILGATSVQRGALWWASHHRLHHQRSDQPDDVHSPRQQGFLWSHMGWITSEANFRSELGVVRDLAKFPELMFLDRFDVLVPTLLGFALFGLGAILQREAPTLHTSGAQMLIWGFFISTVALLHGTFTINSLAHVIGRRRYETGDDSRNSFTLAMVTLGEGWHNNHHHYPAAARNGFFWWEIDITFYVLKMLEAVGVIWDLRKVPEELLDENRVVARSGARAARRSTVVRAHVTVQREGERRVAPALQAATHKVASLPHLPEPAELETERVA